QNSERQTCRYNLTWPFRSNFIDADSYRASNFLARQDAAELRIALSHFPKSSAIDAAGRVLRILIDANRNLSDLQIEHNFIRTGLLIGELRRVQIKRCAQRRVTGKRQLFR